jgi:LPXTG-motif cell wall-anchored protein
MNWSVAGALLLALAVMLGAFGAHGLRDRLDAYSMGVYEKAVFYHFIHALGLLIVSFLPKTSGTNWSSWLLLGGVAIFSGSLYLLAITGNRMLGAITPIGGVSFIAAWLVLAWSQWGK